MPSGKQLGELNWSRFKRWREGKTDDDFRGFVGRGTLHRERVAEACGFLPGALNQNPRIKEALKALEDELRGRGVLPPKVIQASPAVADPAHTIEAPDALRSDAPVKVEAAEALPSGSTDDSAEIAELKRRLARFELLQEVLVATGRLPR